MIRIIGSLEEVDVKFLESIFEGMDAVDNSTKVFYVEDGSGKQRAIEPRCMNFRFESNLLAERFSIEFQKSILVRRFGEEFSDYNERVVKMGGGIYPVFIKFDNVGMQFKYFQV